MNHNSNPVRNERLQRRHFVLLALLFLISISSLLMIYILFPEIDPYVDKEHSQEKKNLKYFQFRKRCL